MTMLKRAADRIRDFLAAALWPIVRDEPSRRDAADDIRAMKWSTFHLLLAEGFRLQGFVVKEMGGESADMVLTKQEGTWLVDCRHWKAAEVGANAAGRLYGAMGRMGAKGGFVITAGRFDAGAIEFARGLNVELIAGRELARMLEIAKETVSGAIPVRPLST